MTPVEIDAKTREQFGEKVAPALTQPKKGDAFLVVQPAALREVCEWLRTQPELAFDGLMNVTGVDYPKEQKIRVVYHLHSYKHLHDFVLKVELDRAAPAVPSLVPVWPGANWLEREAYDLLGVKFEGHPDLRRILLPDDWTGHPLRKDYQEAGGYHGISNERENTVDLLLRLDQVKKAEVEKVAAEKAALEKAAAEKAAAEKAAAEKAATPA